MKTEINIEKEFVPYTESLALKELGFKSPYPIGGYQGGKVFYYEKGKLYYDSRPIYSSDAHSGQLLAPTYSQAFRWFRGKYGIMHRITSYAFGYQIHFDNTPDNSIKHIDRRYDSDIDYTTYEEAELACLRKLIEIVKTKLKQ